MAKRAGIFRILLVFAFAVICCCATRADGGRPTVAVVTFETLPAELKDNAWIGAGFSESVSAKLAAAEFPSLAVYERRMLGRTLREAGVSQSDLSGGGAAVEKASRAVAAAGIDFLVLGSFQVAGKWDSPDTRFEFNGRVVDTRTGKLDWARTVSVSGKIGAGGSGMFDAHSELARTLLDALGVKVESAKKPSKLASPETDNIDAYRHYVLGQQARDAGDSAGAISHFEQAVELSDSFVRALMAKGDTYKEMYETSAAPGKKEVGDSWESSARGDVKSLDTAAAAAHYNLALALVSRCETEGAPGKCDEAATELEKFKSLNMNKSLLWSEPGYTQDFALTGTGVVLLKYGAVYMHEKTTGKLLWKADTGTGGAMIADNEVSGGELLLRGIHDMDIYYQAYSLADGKKLRGWKKPLSGKVNVAFSSGGVLLVDESEARKWVVTMHAAADGAEVWRAELEGASEASVPLLGEGVAIVYGEDMAPGAKSDDKSPYFTGLKLYALDAASGKLLWSYKPAGASVAHASPRIVGGLLLLNWGGEVSALSPADGKPVWKIPVALYRVGYPFVAAGGAVFFLGCYEMLPVEDAPEGAFGCVNDEVKQYAVELRTGKKLREIPPGYDFEAADGDIVAFSKTLYNLSTGEEVMTIPSEPEIWIESISGGRVYAVDDKFVYSIDMKTGRTLWQYEVENMKQVEEKDGVVYVGGGSFAALGREQGSAGPDDVAAGLLEAKAMTLLGKQSEARAAYEKAASDRPNEPGAWSGLAEVCESATDHACAAGAAVNYLNRFPAGADAKRMTDILTKRSPVAWVYIPEGGPLDVEVSGGMLFARMENGTIQSLDAKDGAVKWTNKTDVAGAMPSHVAASGALVLADYYAEGAPDEAAHPLAMLDARTGKRLWSTRTGCDEMAFNRPMGFFPGGAYRACGRTLSAYEPKSGKLLWSYKTESSLGVMDAEYDAGRFFIESEKIEAVDAKSGKALWEYAYGGGAFPANTRLSAHGGALLFTINDSLLALDEKSGEVMWSYKYRPDSADDRTTIELAADGGRVFFANYDKLAALDVKTGKELWNVTEGFNIAIDTALRAEGGKVYYNTGGALYVLDAADGKQLAKWRQASALTGVTRAVGADGAVYLCDDFPGRLFALGADVKSEQWQFDAGGGSKLRETGGGLLMVTEKTVYALDPAKAAALAARGEKWWKEPNTAAYYFNRAENFYSAKDYAVALPYYDRAIEIDPNHSWHIFCRGDAYFFKGDYEKAITDYTRAIELDPYYARYYRARADAYRHTSRNAEAEADVKKADELEGK